ncbi:putative signal peptide protein and transmembrane domain containing protein [Cryptosporidium canis]|uniref:Signal peptide protein and transmembrane domain containing protein n=1 Tax=Cryptosporidium canis TaxID=195482 RepID=A0A9D5DFV7_9CRYT|nr:putative signal peptide protein and transmembrane domain containing protein [Cryptosporidium canis]
MNGIGKLSNKNNILLVSFLAIFVFATIGIGIYINIEISNIWINYNILLNSILENTRALYLGFNDGIIQFYSCDNHLKKEIQLEMSEYLSIIPSIIFSFPYSFCLSNFDLKNIVGNNYYNYLSSDKESWIVNSSMNFYYISEGIEKCMEITLVRALAQESAFLQRTIIDSKRQIWAIHQNMNRYAINKSNLDITFGQNSLVCNYSTILDNEGSPKITGVIINGSEYQAPIFKVSKHLLDLGSNNFSISATDVTKEGAERIENQQIYSNSNYRWNSQHLSNVSELMFHDYKYDTSQIESLFSSKTCLGRENEPNSNELKATSNPRANFEGNHHFADILNLRMLSDISINMSDYSASKSAFTRTIYIPTSSILNNIEVFSEGMKEIKRNSSNNLSINIMLLQVLSSIMALITLLFILSTFVPLITVENEKRKEVFSNHGYLIVERYKHFTKKYSTEINRSLEEFYILFEHLFSTIQKVIVYHDNDYENTLEAINSDKAQIITSTKYIELVLVYKQVVGIAMYRLCFIWKFSIFNSCCIRELISNCNQNFKTTVNHRNIVNTNSMLEIVPLFINRSSQMIEALTDYNSQFENIDYLDFILICIVISNLTYYIDSKLGPNKKIKLIFGRKSIKLLINIQDEDKYILNSQLILSDLLIDSFGESRSERNIYDFFDEFIIENSLLRTLIEKLNMELSIKKTPYSIEINLTNKTNPNQTIFCRSENTFKQTEYTKFGLSTVFALDIIDPYHDFIIEDECSKMGIQFIRGKSSNLNLAPIFHFESLIIFTEKTSIPTKEFVKAIIEAINNFNIIEVAIYWLCDNDATNELLVGEFDPNKSSLIKYHFSESSNGGNLPYKLKDKFNYKKDNLEGIKYLHGFGNKARTEVNHYILGRSPSRLIIRKIISNVAFKEARSCYKSSYKYSKIQNIIDILENSVHAKLSTKNYIASSFILNLNSSVNFKKQTYDECLLDRTGKVSGYGFPIPEIKKILSTYSLKRTYKWDTSVSQKPTKVYLTNSDSSNKTIDYNILTSNIFFTSDDELTHEIRCATRDILLLSSIDMISEKIDLIMEFWELVKLNIIIKDENILKFYCSRLVLHSIVTLKIFVKKSTNTIENMVYDFNSILALIISFISIPLFKPGISSRIVSFLNKMVSVYANELAPLEVQICCLIENILSLPKFSGLFDNFEKCKKMIMINILSLNEDLSIGIRQWIDESANNQELVIKPLTFYEPIVNYIVGDQDLLFVSVLFNTSKFTLSIECDIIFFLVLYSPPIFEKDYSLAWIKRWIVQKYWENRLEEEIIQLDTTKISVNTQQFSDGFDLFRNFTIPWLNAMLQLDQLHSKNLYSDVFYIETFSKIRSNFDIWNDEYKKNSWDI